MCWLFSGPQLSHLDSHLLNVFILKVKQVLETLGWGALVWLDVRNKGQEEKKIRKHVNVP